MIFFWTLFRINIKTYDQVSANYIIVELYSIQNWMLVS